MLLAPLGPAVAGSVSSTSRLSSAEARAAIAAQASFVIAMTIPIRTNRTIAACIQIQVGDTGSA
jgi:hypothetical protein